MRKEERIMYVRWVGVGSIWSHILSITTATSRRLKKKL